MGSKFMGVMCLMFAGMNVWFMLSVYPSTWWILHAVGSLYFTYRTVWWFDRSKLPAGLTALDSSKLPADLTVEQYNEIREASEIARQMLSDGKDKQEVVEWLNARLNLIRSKGQPTETNQGE